MIACGHTAEIGRKEERSLQLEGRYRATDAYFASAIKSERTLGRIWLRT